MICIRKLSCEGIGNISANTGMMSNKENAIFFDRDGVVINDVHLLTDINDVVIPPLTIEAFKLISGIDYKKIVITNQTVISRGLSTQSDVSMINDFIINKIFEETGCKIEKMYVCPHHPEATLNQYKKVCECRKPKPGMILQASKDYGINLNKSWMIGDRISDIVAGSTAGCKTILLQTGMHRADPIVSDSMNFSVRPDLICKNLFEAAEIITKEYQA